MSTKAILVIAVAVFLVTASVGAFAAMSDESPPPPEARPPVAAVSPSITESLGAFRRAGSASDQLPPDIAQLVRRAAPNGANPELARRVGALGGRELYLVPADDSVVTVLTDEQGGAALGVRSVDQIRTGAVGPARLGIGDDSIVYSPVTDGVHSVEVERKSGARESVPVRDNAYLFASDLGRRAISVAYKSRAGEVRHEIDEVRTPAP